MSDAAATGNAAKAAEAACDDSSGTERDMLPKAKILLHSGLTGEGVPSAHATHSARRKTAYRCKVLLDASKKQENANTSITPHERQESERTQEFR